MSRIDSLLEIRGKRMTEWGTPRAFMDWLDVEKGFKPNLDPAASIRNTKAPHFYSEEDDGLSKPWHGHVWLNPPYGSEIGSWVEKCAEEIKSDLVKSIYVLVPARTDTKWFHEIVMPHAYIVYLIKGRFNFVGEEAADRANAPFPSMLIVYRRHKLRESGITILEVPSAARGFQ